MSPLEEHPSWIKLPPWTDEELEKVRKNTFVILGGEQPLTCDACPDQRDCVASMDAYNVQGRCRLLK